MNFMLLFGLAISLFSIAVGVPGLLDNLDLYVDPYSFLLVLGGTVGAAMISASFRDFKAVLAVLSGWMYMKRKVTKKELAVQKIVEVAEAASRSGKASVLEMGKGFGDGFLDRSLELMGSGLELDFVRNALETNIFEGKRRHARIVTLVRSMGSFAPMFGMMGTVIGVIQVLQNVQDINAVVAGMSLALMTTLYGTVLSSLLFVPIANKLQSFSEEEALNKEMMMEGVLAIMDNQIPLKVEKLLHSYLSSKAKSKKAK